VATRRDQLHSYQFLIQRVISAFVMRETDPAQSPLRRGIGAVFGGVMIAVLVAAGFGIYGILTKVGTDTWRTDRAVIIERETGASYVLLNGTLRPTLNYASALLASARTPPAVFRVSGRALADTPRGTPIGIVGAPDSLPGADRRIGLPWTVCAMPRVEANGQVTSEVGVAVGVAPTGGQTLADEAVLVRDATLDSRFIIWHGRRHLVDRPDVVLPALFAAATPVDVRTAWLNAVPAGAIISPVDIPGRGRQSSAVRGRVVGELLTTPTGSGPQHHVVLDDGLAPITGLQRDILRAERAEEPATVPLAEINNAPRSERRLVPPEDGQAPPTVTPTLVRPGAADAVCAVTTDQGVPEIRSGGEVAGLTDATLTTGTDQGGAALADRVLVPPGRVAAIQVQGAPDAPAGPYFVLTDTGRKYPVPDAGVLGMLGFGPDAVVGVPASLVARIPSGPTLDPRAALQPAAAP
jgi:type VII secretion protein EccB